MATSLLTLLDDIATVLDDVAVMTKVAAKKTAGVLGDDLALNAQQVSGVETNREWPVVWAVAKGSFWNKAILVPAALLISAVAPFLIVPLLILGGAYLCFEGCEKLYHAWFHQKDSHAAEQTAPVNMAAFEAEKIKGAVRTDFILSAEIIVIALGTVALEPLLKQASVLVAISLLMTVGVYGLVAGIVKIDDVGLHLSRQTSAAQQKLGRGLLVFAPYLMKTLSVVGTAAMFLVGGGILSHNWPWLHHLSEAAAPFGFVVDGVAGVLLGGLVLAGVEGVKRVRG